MKIGQVGEEGSDTSNKERVVGTIFKNCQFSEPRNLKDRVKVKIRDWNYIHILNYGSIFMKITIFIYFDNKVGI